MNLPSSSGGQGLSLRAFNQRMQKDSLFRGNIYADVSL